MFEFRPDETLAPRGWVELPGRIQIACPLCGRIKGLKPETIDSRTGISTTSVFCPKPDCTFHDMVKLKGWKPRAAAEVPFELQQRTAR